MRKMSIMAYGASGVGKSTQARYLAKYVHDIYKLRTRFICTDGGSLWEALADYVEAGFVDTLLVPAASDFNPFAIMNKIAKGMWPEGGIVNRPTPKKIGNDTRYETNTKWLPWTDHETDTIGLIVTDSLTGYSSMLLNDFAIKSNRKGSDPGNSGEEEGEKFGSNTLTHYGDVQTTIKNYINAVVALPCPFSYFTALEDGGTENVTGVKRPVFGPQIAGNAATGELPKMVTNCFHLQAEGVGAERKVRAFYDDHPDPSLPPNMKWKAKASSIRPEQRLDFVKTFSGGFIPLTLDKGIRTFMEFKDSADATMREPKK
jgi:hypothetical protein